MSKYIYVGCGNHRLDGFCHVDIDYAKKFSKGKVVSDPDYICDIVENLPFKDNSVELIYSRQTLEHLTYRELVNHLIECHRVLKIGGKIRLGVPDLDIMVKNFNEKKINIENEKKSWEINENFPIDNHSEFFVAQILYHDHRYNHNYETMQNCIAKIGYSKITKNSAGDFIFNNEIIRNGVNKSELEAKNQLVVTAEKTLDNTKINKYNLQKRINIINQILKKIFNLKLTASNHRKPHFPQKNFFKEKIFFLKKKLIKLF